MKVNILTYSEDCEKFLTFIPFSSRDSIDINLVDPFSVEDDFKLRTNKPYGWSSWLEIRNFSYLKKSNINKKTRDELEEDVLKTNLYSVKEFIDNNKTLTIDKLQQLFFNKKDEKYLSETYSNRLKSIKKKGINEQCFGVSLEFVYYEDEEQELIANNEDLQEGYKQLKIFYDSVTEKYHPSILYMLPHYDPLAEDEKYFLKHGIYPGDYGEYEDYSPEKDFLNFNPWEEVGKEEERRMDEETDGFWRID